MKLNTEIEVAANAMALIRHQIDLDPASFDTSSRRRWVNLGPQILTFLRGIARTFTSDRVWLGGKVCDLFYDGFTGC